MLRHSGATIPSGPLPGKTPGNASVFGLRTTLKVLERRTDEHRGGHAGDALVIASPMMWCTESF
jgi:hypothetical protein